MLRPTLGRPTLVKVDVLHCGILDRRVTTSARFSKVSPCFRAKGGQSRYFVALFAPDSEIQDQVPTLSGGPFARDTLGLSHKSILKPEGRNVGKPSGCSNPQAG
jgi:hypothetical protein